MIADICRATLGDNAYLFWEQYVVKGASEGMKFSWHQDSGYVAYPDHKPYLTCWCALDDMSEENGTVYVMPFSHIGIRSWVKHIREEGSNDLVGYFGEKKGDSGSRLQPGASPLLQVSISIPAAQIERRNSAAPI